MAPKPPPKPKKGCSTWLSLKRHYKQFNDSFSPSGIEAYVVIV